MAAPAPLPFDGVIDGNLSPNVLVENKKAMVDTTATNRPPYVGLPSKTSDKAQSNRAGVWWSTCIGGNVEAIDYGACRKTADEAPPLADIRAEELRFTHFNGPLALSRESWHAAF